MTDTGRVPGEGLPEDAGMVAQPGIPAPEAYTFLEPSENAAEDDDLLLMPGAQGAWSDPQVVPPPAPQPAQELPQQVAQAPAPQAAADFEPQPAPEAQTAPAAQPLPQPAPQPDGPGAHEAGGRDSGFVDLSAVRTPQPAPAAAQAPAPARRPLHLGPPVPDATGGVVRSLADRGPAAGAPSAPVMPQSPAPVQQPAPQITGLEYLDMPGNETASLPGPQLGTIPSQAAQPWPRPQESPAETVAPAAVTPEPAAPQPAPVAEQPVSVPAEPVAVAPEPPAAEAQQPLPPQTPFVPVEDSVPAEPHAAPAPVIEPPAEPVAAAPEPASEPTPVPQPAEATAPEPVEPTAAQDPAPEPAAVAAEPQPQPTPESAEEAAEPQPEPVAEAAEPQPAPEPVAAVAEPQPEPVVTEAQPEPAPAQATEPIAAPEPEPAPAPAAEPFAPEEQRTEPIPAATEPVAEAFVPEAAAPVLVPAPRDGGLAAELPVQPGGPAVELPVQQAPAPEAPPQPQAAAETAPAAPSETAAETAPAAPIQPAVETAPAPASEPAAETAPAAPSEPAPEPTAAAAPEQAPEPAPATPVAAATAPAPGYDDAEREAVLRVMRERRDIRNGFRADPIPHEVLLRVLEAAHTAPSVGHSQPWDFVVIRSAETRRTMHELAVRQRDAYAKSLPKGRAKQFKELKIEAILDTPVNIVVTADPTRGGRHTLGRHTQPQMAPYSSALAVENLWLAARAEGLGVGWVSFFDEREMVRALGLPEHLEVVAYLCVGYVDEFPEEPELMQAGWSKRRPLSWVVHEETYGRRALPGEEPHDLLQETVSNIRPLDAKALGEAWERQKRMTKPAGALGMLEIISAQLSGLSRMCPPPIPEPAAVAIFAGDHGVHAQGVTAWPQEVTSQMVANILGGGAVCNAFASQVGAEVCVVDVGVAGELPSTPGLLPRKVRAGTADFTTGPALTHEEVLAAIEVGIETARDLVAAGNKALVTGEMGIANTTVSAALIAVYTGQDPAEITGRGTGINDEMHARKVDVVRRALELHQPDPADPIGVLAAVGGLEHAALVGFLLGGASLRTPVILDGVSAGAAALVARAIAPESLAACIAGHRSAEPGHVAALNKLGLRPLVDLDLRLGEGTGALLALPVVQSAARAMHEVATFDSAGVTEK
ncbi:nicotinate-nucleotide--dimethylbenzimidazole phosphoribosyltransferase [Streptomyces sp. NPDC054887]